MLDDPNPPRNDDSKNSTFGHVFMTICLWMCCCWICFIIPIALLIFAVYYFYTVSLNGGELKQTKSSQSLKNSLSNLADKQNDKNMTNKNISNPVDSRNDPKIIYKSNGPNDKSLRNKS